MGQITDYDSLQTEIAAYLNRSDLEATIPLFIQFVEADLNTRLRARQMIIRAQATSENEYVQLPTDWLEAINIHIIDGVQPLRYVSLDKADQIIKDHHYSKPTFYSLMNGAIEMVPPPGSDIEIEMIYYGKIAALSDANTSNWLLVKAPDVYLYGALVHASPFLLDDQRIPVFASFYSQRVDALIEESGKSLHSGGPLVAKTRNWY
jgi:hypothetical protein